MANDKIKNLLRFYNYCCSQNPQYIELYKSAMIGDLLRIQKQK